MGTSGSLRIQRPYDSQEAYLEGDAWTVSRSDVVLIEVAELPEGTAIGFEIALTTGEVVVRGEGRAVGMIAASAGRPGGLRVRFQKLDSESKAMLRRALEVQKRGSLTRADETRSAPDASTRSELEQPSRQAVRAEHLVATPAMPTGGDLPDASPVTPERSGVRHRAPGAIVAPENRDTLLARLRERAPQIAKRRTAAE